MLQRAETRKLEALKLEADRRLETILLEKSAAEREMQELLAEFSAALSEQAAENLKKVQSAQAREDDAVREITCLRDQQESFKVQQETVARKLETRLAEQSAAARELLEATAEYSAALSEQMAVNSRRSPPRSAVGLFELPRPPEDEANVC